MLSGVNRPLMDKFTFRVEGKPFSRDTGFTTCSGLEDTTEVVKYRGGGSLYEVKSPGLASVNEITLTRGQTQDLQDLLDWYQLVSKSSTHTRRPQGGATGSGLSNPASYMYTIDIVQTDRQGRPRLRWRLYNAWPSKVVPFNGLDNNANERAMEELVLQCDYWELREKNTGVQLNVSLETPFGTVSAGAGRDNFLNFDPGNLLRNVGII